MELTFVDCLSYFFYFGIIAFILANYVGIEKVSKTVKNMMIESGFEIEDSYTDWVIPRMFKHVIIHLLKIALKSFFR